MTPGSSTKAGSVPTTTGDTNEFHLIDMNRSNQVLKNLTLKGTNQGHFYNGLRIGNGSVSPQTGNVVDNVLFWGCWPGNQNFPPGETFGVDTNHTDGCRIINCELDGRDPDTGNRTGASPIGFNTSTNCYVADTYAHHGRTGMLTFWQCSNIHTVRYRCVSTASGSGVFSGSGINHEQVSGEILHESPNLSIDRAGGNTGLHITIFNDATNASPFQITNITHDAGPEGTFSVGYYNGSNAQTTKPTVTKGGVTLTAAAGGTGGSAATRYHYYD